MSSCKITYSSFSMYCLICFSCSTPANSISQKRLESDNPAVVKSKANTQKENDVHNTTPKTKAVEPAKNNGTATEGIENEIHSSRKVPDTEVPLPEKPDDAQLDQKQKFGRYYLYIYNTVKKRKGQFYEIALQDKIVYRSEVSHKYETWSSKTERCIKGKRKWLDMGRDITGDNSPNLLVWRYSGGMKCCLSVDIFTLGKLVGLVQTLAFRESCAFFTDLDTDGYPEIVLKDTAFGYWLGDWSESDLPDVILKWNGTRYAYSGELSRNLIKPKLLNMEANRKLYKVTEQKNDDDHLRGLSNIMLSLIYAGYKTEAWQLFNQAWDDRVPGKENFRTGFEDNLHGSQFWPEIKQYADTVAVQKSP